MVTENYAVEATFESPGLLADLFAIIEGKKRVNMSMYYTETDKVEKSLTRECFRAKFYSHIEDAAKQAAELNIIFNDEIRKKLHMDSSFHVVVFEEIPTKEGQCKDLTLYAWEYCFDEAYTILHAKRGG